MALLDGVDIALVLDTIRPNAKWRMAGTYELLKWTWEDRTQTLPTEQEILDAWPTVQQKWADITDEPSGREILEALLEAAASTTKIDNIRARLAKAKTARGEQKG